MKVFRLAHTLALSTLTALTLSCESSEPLAGPEGASPQFVKQGVDCTTESHPSCPDGEAPGTTVNLALAGAINTSAAGEVEVRTDNASTLELGNGGYVATFGFAASIPPCVTKGVFGDDNGRISESTLLGLLTTGTPAINRNLEGLKIDKTVLSGDGSSTQHHLRHGWRASASGASLGGDIGTWIADPSFDKKSPVPSGPTGWEPTPQVVESSSGSYTFNANHGIVLVKQLYGRPKDHPTIVCPLLDNVTATVSSSP